MPITRSGFEWKGSGCTHLGELSILFSVRQRPFFGLWVGFGGLDYSVELGFAEYLGDFFGQVVKDQDSADAFEVGAEFGKGPEAARSERIHPAHREHDQRGIAR